MDPTDIDGVNVGEKDPAVTLRSGVSESEMVIERRTNDELSEDVGDSVNVGEGVSEREGVGGGVIVGVKVLSGVGLTVWLIVGDFDALCDPSRVGVPNEMEGELELDIVVESGVTDSCSDSVSVRVIAFEKVIVGEGVGGGVIVRENDPLCDRVARELVLVAPVRVTLGVFVHHVTELDLHSRDGEKDSVGGRLNVSVGVGINRRDTLIELDG
jgi:hypothetical protein